MQPNRGIFEAEARFPPSISPNVGPPGHSGRDAFSTIGAADRILAFDQDRIIDSGCSMSSWQ
jgi:hypothetical protein